MKRQLDRLKGKRLVTGDPNLMTKDEICINATPNGVEVKEIGTDGSIKDIASGSGSGELDINSLTLSDLYELNTFNIITKEYPYFMTYFPGLRWSNIVPERIEQINGITAIGITYMEEDFYFSKEKGFPQESDSISVVKIPRVEIKEDGIFAAIYMCVVNSLSFILCYADDEEILNLLMDELIQGGI